MIVIGSRGSALALAQTNWVADRIRYYNPGVETRIEIIRTKGDKILDTPLAKIGDKGLFVREIELALLAGRIDLAVHSMKDLPTDLTEGLTIGAVPSRVDPSDVLLTNGGGISSLAPGSRVGSSSLRRRAQLTRVRPDLDYQDIRGNLDTRVRRLQTGDYDAIVLAYAGLQRLKWTGEITERLPFDVCLPAVGQGALALQIKQDDDGIALVLNRLDDPPSRMAVESERAFLAALGGGCQTPIAALASPKGDSLVIDAMVASLDGSQLVRTQQTGNFNNAESLGKRTAEILLEMGAGDILDQVHAESGPTNMGAA